MNERDNPTTDPLRLVELELRERLEQRLWSRARWSALVLVLVLGAFGTLAYFAARGAIERSAVERSSIEFERARAELLESIEANKTDIPALRQELREDAKYIKDQLITSQVDLQFKMQELLAQTAKLEESMAQVDEEAEKLTSLRSQISQLQRNISTETSRLESMRQRYETELSEFTTESDRLKMAVPIAVDQQMETVGRLVERELDELRAIIADHTAGLPSLFTTWLDLNARSGHLNGTNFGADPGRVFVRVRAFPPEGSEMIAESESVLVPLGTWADSLIELKLSSRVLEELAEARDKVTSGRPPTTTLIRYGFLVQAADGRMSHWSDKWADSVIPPSHGTTAKQ